MATERNWKTRFRYRFDEFLASGAGKQLLMLFALTLAVVLIHSALSVIFAVKHDDSAGFWEMFWFYFTRSLDAGTMSADAGTGLRVLATVDTILGVIVAGLLISSLSGNFQSRLENIRRGSSAVDERHHFLILGWSEKIFSIIDQLAEANIEKGRITVVVMAEGDKMAMEDDLRGKLVHLKRIKLVVRQGSSQSVSDLTRVACDQARGVVVLVDQKDLQNPSRADGRVIKTLMALYNHPLGKQHITTIPVTAEIMQAEAKDIAEIAAGGRANIIKTNEIISKIILQTARITGLSLIYDELLRFEGNEIHYARFPQAVGRRFGDLILDFPNGCLVGIAKADGSSHKLNPPTDRVLAPDEELLILAEDDHIRYAPYAGALAAAQIQVPSTPPVSHPVEHLLILGWNEKIFPIIKEFENYVGPGSTMTLVNLMPEDERQKLLAERVGPLKNVTVRHTVGDFTSRALMEKLQPERYPTVTVLGDSIGGAEDEQTEDADTRAIIALLLLRDFRQRAGITHQEVCSEILEPRNRELAASTEIHDIVVSNETVSMMLAQVTHEPRVRPVLEDLFESEGSEIYLKDIKFYCQPGQTVSFEYLMLAALARGELALGLQNTNEDAAQRYGIRLNPPDRTTGFVVKDGDRLIVMAESDG
jgi:ion channel POLLUX/CASTOR